MQPAQIRVFDGLRLTTEHLNHLQAALRSGVQELREILGLGVVYRGFEVVASGDGAVTVQPGLAFDFQRNRLVLDEPKTVQVTLGTDEAHFVCLKYDQIEDGQVEGKFTLIWDSCTIVMQATLPSDEDNLLPLAIVSRAADGSLLITSLQVDEETGTAASDEEAPAAAPGATNSAAPMNGEQSTDAETGGSVNGGNVATSTPVTTNGSVTAMEQPPSSNGAPTTETTGEPAPPIVVTIPSQPVWSIRQGVERLAGTNDAGIDLGALLIGPLRNRLAGADSSRGDQRFSLREADIATDVQVLSLTMHTLLTATIAPTDTPPLHISATAQGEATYDDTSGTQWGVATIQAHAGEAAAPMLSSDLTERGVAHVPLGASAANAQPGTIEEVLQHVQIVVRVDRGATNGFKLICNLTWIGEVSEALIDTLQSNKPTLQWNGTLAWKAIGQSSSTTNM